MVEACTSGPRHRPSSSRRPSTTYVRQAAGGSSNVDDLAKLADLKAKGVLSDAEFEAQKAKLLSA